MGYFTELGRRFLAEADDPEAPKATSTGTPSEPTPVNTPESETVIAAESTPEEITQPLNTTGVNPAIMSGSGTPSHVRPPGRSVNSGKELDALQQRLADIANAEENPIEKSHGRGAATAEDHFCSSPGVRWREDHKSKRSQNRSKYKNRRVIQSRDSTLFSAEVGTP